MTNGSCCLVTQKANKPEAAGAQPGQSLGAALQPAAQPTQLQLRQPVQLYWNFSLT